MSIYSFLLQHLVYPLIRKGSLKPYYINALDCLYSITQIPNSSRLWKKEVWDFFLEPDIFQHSTLVLSKWKLLIASLLLIEKEKFLELLVRVSASPTTTLFMSKDMEVQLRVISLRRVTFFLFAGNQDRLLATLPGVQEKLTEILKCHSKSMQIEVYNIKYLSYFRHIYVSLYYMHVSLVNIYLTFGQVF